MASIEIDITTDAGTKLVVRKSTTNKDMIADTVQALEELTTMFQGEAND